ncbi:DNA recombination protein RmuC [Arthrobacter sp. CAU 1506]|uniref:DNA recombination protein RmuC n=1 Tax=Arthrobacter sp. CAU 1506 TaxID=2560052 RepID=UPI0010AD7900|nr:DNA recombination protein RmuC [Arthrobacter sp. CAU 1506]TJY71399.1 DNA recombination protein RmuC [Arthrobacter sp. CAU 1506]
MDASHVLLALLALFIGAAAGAVAVAVLFRRRLADLQHAAKDDGDRLAELSARLAGVEAERRMLAEQNRQLSAQDEQENTVLRALIPVGEKLKLVQQQVSLLERDRVEQFGQLAEQLRAAQRSDEALMRSTQTLASALQSNSARGQWGEVQLRRVVEAAGMLPHVDFDEQVHLAGADRTGRPDMLIRLPGGKTIVADAKVPLRAYLQAQEIPAAASAAEQQQRADLLAAHAKAVRAHVDALAGRKYWENLQASPELVLCFLPSEAVLSAALHADPGLLDHAFARSVALVSPVSLLATLKSVAFTWRQEVLKDNAREIFDLSRQLYERLGTLGEHVTRLGSSLKSSVERYNSFVGTLESRVLPTARKINAFDATVLEEPAAPAALENTPRLLSAPELIENRDPAA